MFLSAQANEKLPEHKERTLLLHPFANTKAFEHDYRVFMEYEKPGE